MPDRSYQFGTEKAPDSECLRHFKWPRFLIISPRLMVIKRTAEESKRTLSLSVNSFFHEYICKNPCTRLLVSESGYLVKPKHTPARNQIRHVAADKAAHRTLLELAKSEK